MPDNIASVELDHFHDGAGKARKVICVSESVGRYLGSTPQLKCERHSNFPSAKGSYLLQVSLLAR